MQKAYHDLKEQALRMSIEQDAQKSQIEEEIHKLKISNQDLIKKNKVWNMEYDIFKSPLIPVAMVIVRSSMTMTINFQMSLLLLWLRIMLGASYDDDYDNEGAFASEVEHFVNGIIKVASAIARSQIAASSYHVEVSWGGDILNISLQILTL